MHLDWTHPFVSERSKYTQPRSVTCSWYTVQAFVQVSPDMEKKSYIDEIVLVIYYGDPFSRSIAAESIRGHVLA